MARRAAAPKTFGDASATATFEALIPPYLAKIRTEREARLNGRTVEADFLLRQVTVFEIALDLSARSEGRIGFEDLQAACATGEFALEDIARSPLCDLLGEARRQAWAERGEPARPVGPAADLLHGHGDLATEPLQVLLGGPDADQAAQRDAIAQRQAAAAVAQVAWEMRLLDAGGHEVRADASDCAPDAP